MHRLIRADCLEYLKDSNETWTTIFADPPDNIGLGYDTYQDRQSDEVYVRLLHDWLNVFIRKPRQSGSPTTRNGPSRSDQRSNKSSVGIVATWKPNLAFRSLRSANTTTTISGTTIGRCCGCVGMTPRWFPMLSASLGDRRTATSGPIRAAGCQAMCSTSPASSAIASNAVLASHATQRGPCGTVHQIDDAAR